VSAVGFKIQPVSESLSVTAADCVRVCRNFRTLTAPSAVQFVSLAVEPAGEVVVAGTQDDFQVSAKEGEG
jgi:periodic tryptophan protein 2